MMYRDDIEKEINELEKDIKGIQKRYNATGLLYYDELKKLRTRQLEAFKKILPQAREKQMASQCVDFNEWRYEPSVCQ